MPTDTRLRWALGVLVAWALFIALGLFIGAQNVSPYASSHGRVDDSSSMALAATNSLTRDGDPAFLIYDSHAHLYRYSVVNEDGTPEQRVLPASGLLVREDASQQDAALVFAPCGWVEQPWAAITKRPCSGSTFHIPAGSLTQH